MANKNLNVRHQFKRGTAADWEKAVNFIPLEGEPVIYTDHIGGRNALKMGDGKTKVNNLAFVDNVSQADIESIVKYGYLPEDVLIVPDNVKDIQTNQYKGKTYKRAVLSNYVTSIGAYAFDSCQELIEVNIPNKLTTLGAHAFSNCPRLKSDLIIPGTLATIPDYAFFDAKRVSSIIIEEGVSKIGIQAFYNCDITNIKIPKSVTEIGANALLGTDRLREIDLTDYALETSFPVLKDWLFGDDGRDYMSPPYTRPKVPNLQILVPKGRKTELAAMTNWSYYTNRIVEVSTPETLEASKADKTALDAKADKSYVDTQVATKSKVTVTQQLTSGTKIGTINVDGTDKILYAPAGYTLPKATTTALGGIKVGYTASGKNYPVQLDTDGDAYVNVPWEDTTYGAASTTAAGLMSAADKSKLDGVAAGANAYSLPAATSSTLGGVKVGSNITVSSGTISLTKTNVTAALGYTPPTTNTTYGIATASTAGLVKPVSVITKPTVNAASTTAGKYYPVQMSSDGNMFVNVPWTTYSLPTASASALGGIKTGYSTSGKNYKVSVDGNGNAYVNVPWKDYAVASGSANGLMSSTDKAKLDGFSAASTYATKDDIAKVYRVKGSCTYADMIALKNAEVGDVWNITDAAGANYVCTVAKTAGASSWDMLGSTISIDSITTAQIDALFA